MLSYVIPQNQNDDGRKPETSSINSQQQQVPNENGNVLVTTIDVTALGNMAVIPDNMNALNMNGGGLLTENGNLIPGVHNGNVPMRNDAVVLTENANLPAIQASPRLLLTPSPDEPSVSSVVEEKSIIRTQNGKTQSLKRVSFGSSKGSMVETLIYDDTVTGEPPTPGTPPQRPTLQPLFTVNDRTESGKPPSRVRVTFYESQKPLYLNSPDSSETTDTDWIMATPSPTPDYQRQLSYPDSIHSGSNIPPLPLQGIVEESTDSGMDNPFRPDGELAKEADELVEMINKGKPITATPSPKPSDSPDHSQQLNGSVEEPLMPTSISNSLQATPGKTGSNGSVVHGQNEPVTPVSSNTVEVQRHVVPPPGAASQPEHVVIKKKSKGKCCVIQ